MISKDLDDFLKSYHQAKNYKSQEIPKSEFRGEAGVLELTFEVNTINLKQEVVSYIRLLHNKRQNKTAKIDKLNALFDNYVFQIEIFNSNNLSFLNKQKFTKEKIEKYLMICKYAMYEKLNLAYKQVLNDLTLIKSKLCKLKANTYNASYEIDFLNTIVDISNLNDYQLNFKPLKTLPININGSYLKFAEQYIIEELILMSFVQKAGEVNHFVKSNELDFFICQYQEVFENGGEASLHAEFKGEGGQLFLTIEIKSLRRIKSLIFLSYSKLLLYIITIVYTIALVINFEIYHSIFFLIICVAAFLIVLNNGFKKEIKKIKDFKIDLKRHGK
jgi:hypothetical protein